MNTEEPPVATGSGLSGKRIAQLSFFVEDRLVALHKALHALDPQPIRICALDVPDGSEHAVVRLVVDRPSVAADLLRAAGHTVYVRSLLAVALPREHERRVGVRDVLHALLSAEIAVTSAYALHVTLQERSVLVLDVEAVELAERAIVESGFELVEQAQLGWGEDAR